MLMRLKYRSATSPAKPCRRSRSAGECRSKSPGEKRSRDASRSYCKNPSCANFLNGIARISCWMSISVNSSTRANRRIGNSTASVIPRRCQDERRARARGLVKAQLRAAARTSLSYRVVERALGAGAGCGEATPAGGLALTSIGDRSSTQGRVGCEHAVVAMAVAPGRRPTCGQSAPRDGRICSRPGPTR